MSVVIKLKNINKSYKGIKVLNNINLEINSGKIIGIIGANGSGKSVLFKTICGFIAPDTGDVYIRGLKLGDKIDFPEDVGIFINEPGYMSLFTGFMNLKFLADINKKIDINKIRSTMIKVGLDPDNDVKVKDYSLGMKQKLGIAQAIMEEQDILILDEPFNALDYKTYDDIKSIIKSLQDEGKTILLTSHNFNDIDQLCDDIYIINNGELSLATDEIIDKYRYKNRG
ncbi:ATP-binding cassette domain-containing protein [Romboutsia sp. CE17]|uniref:ABC transporter ATP-binding protein n=1 Tax=Romboutsia sp. CE17 TaxID=2724150 RepID=UPI001442B71E|nr:ATP-binding cassette domain-containing protein [Romboutsia sp. CE17]QJA07486.1 ATP-binding cassette domain-containing protein [Romboutsia sp. CE17]